MQVPIIVLSAVLALIFLVSGVAKLVGHPMMREAAATLGFSFRAYRLIGLLEIAGAAGLMVGLLWSPLAIAAATGCLLLMVGAVYFQRRANDSVQEMGPALLSGATAIAILVLYAASA